MLYDKKQPTLKDKIIEQEEALKGEQLVKVKKKNKRKKEKKVEVSKTSKKGK